MRILVLLISLFTLAPSLLWGQGAPLEPFVCRGDFYQAMAPFRASSIHRVVVDPVTERVDFLELPAGSLGTPINPIGYRITDNFIYGISPSSLGLFRIGADGRGQRLGTIGDMLDGLDYPAGCISPDGRYFVLLGIEQGREPLTGSSEVLLFIDLESPDFATRRIDLPANNIQSFDIAFDPIDGRLYGYDANERRLFTIDPDNGDLEVLPATNSEAESIGSLFFDPFGRLYAYGNRTFTEKQSSYFAIDKATGFTQLLAQGPEAQLTDGCSCPYTVAMEQRISPSRAIACSAITITLDLVNSSGIERSGLTLSDDFPPGFTITGIETTLAADVVSGVGSNRLRLENLVLPLGNSQVRITLRSAAGITGDFADQAFLEGLPLGLGGSVRSDNPATLVREDPGTLSVGPIPEEERLRAFRICPGESVTLDPELEGVQYRWPDGSTDPQLTVDQPGLYPLAVSTACSTDTVTFRVDLDALEVDLPAATTLFLGESLTLRPTIAPEGDYDYRWRSTDPELDCRDCREVTVQPINDATYTFSAYDPMTGCRNQDSLLVRVVKDRAVFFPNAFSPNGDGRNDYFFPQTRIGEYVRAFRVFNRWGELVYQQGAFATNDETQGWDGTLRGRPLPAGTYFYVAEVTYRDEVRQTLSGDVTLIR